MILHRASPGWPHELLAAEVRRTKTECGMFMCLMYPWCDAPSEFDYPVDRLFKLRGILSATQISQTSNHDSKGDPVRFVIKCGLATHTTGLDSVRRPIVQ